MYYSFWQFCLHVYLASSQVFAISTQANFKAIVSNALSVMITLGYSLVDSNPNPSWINLCFLIRNKFYSRPNNGKRGGWAEASCQGITKLSIRGSQVQSQCSLQRNALILFGPLASINVNGISTNYHSNNLNPSEKCATSESSVF